MIKKILYKYLVFIVFISFPLIVVNAGVCDGYTKNSEYGTCNSLTISVTKALENLGTKDKGYFLRPGYNSTGNSIAFCLDPGLPRPDKELNVIREIDNSTESKMSEFDDSVYKMYQYFYNNLLYLKNNSNLNTNNLNKERTYLQNALRVLVYKTDNGYLESKVVEYKNDASNFKTCASYIDSTLKNDSDVNKSYCFGNSPNIEKIKNYYEYKDKKYIWENPIKIETSLTNKIGLDGKQYYRYNFDISFSNANYSFFDSNYSKGIDYGDIHLDNAEFYLEGFAINESINCVSKNECADFTGNGVVSSGTSTNFFVELSEEQYNSYKDASGNVSVTMNYAYKHPLNIENLFIARYDLKNSYQRMLIIKDYIHHDSIATGNVKMEESKCKHDETGFVNSKGKRVNIEEFKTSCGCNYINESLLNDSDLTYYNSMCSGFITNESYNGNINKCDESEKYSSTENDINYSDYYLQYTKQTNINKYCKETCTERIDIKDLKGRYTTKAGTYFSFTKYPELVSKKHCEVSIDYTILNKDYYDNLKKLVDAYNNWQDAKAAQASEDSSGDCNPHCCGYDLEGNCTGTCYDILYTYDYSYNKANIKDSVSIEIESVRGTPRSSCGTRIDFGVGSKKNAFQALSSEAKSINNIKSSLNVCNNRLFLDKEDEAFYNYKYQLNYYYYQTYSDKKIGTIKNSERSSYGGINDSQFAINKSTKSGYNNKNDGYYKTYSTLTESGKADEQILNYNTNIIRNVTYDIKYSRPKENKNVLIYSGTITLDSPKDKYINLGYVYDIDASAVAKTGNQTYYEFTNLGATDKKIFNHFKDGNSIKRYCDYEITNDLIKSAKPNFVFKIVDSNNIDPNNRLNSINSGFENWKNDKGYATKKAIESADNYNPDNLEYSFTLDSSTIKAIREYNVNCDKKECNPISYSDTSSKYSELTCTNGEKCISNFITTAINKSDIFGKSFATIYKGRNSWKTFELKEGKYYIDGNLVK